MDINKELDKLCLEHFKEKAYVADGIFYYSDVNSWNDINPKVLFILKQPNSDDLLGEDYREYDFDTCYSEQVWKELIGRMYGIMNTTEQEIPDYNKAMNPKTLKEAFTHYPFAVINIIKDIGAGTTSTRSLKRYAIENIIFLKGQIDILQPDIIVCCGTGVFDIMNKVITPSIESNGNWLKYNKERNIIFFDTYHPGKPNTFKTLKEAYEKPLEEYSNFKRNKASLL